MGTHWNPSNWRRSDGKLFVYNKAQLDMIWGETWARRGCQILRPQASFLAMSLSRSVSSPIYMSPGPWQRIDMLP